MTALHLLEWISPMTASCYCSPFTKEYASYRCFMLQWFSSQERSHRTCNYHQAYVDATVLTVCSGTGALMLAPATAVISHDCFWLLQSFYQGISHMTASCCIGLVPRNGPTGHVTIINLHVC